MSDEDVRARADRRFAAALERTGARDPRDFYRARLRELREQNEAAFREALAHYENELLPAVAREGSDPIAVWLEYGRLLARLTVDGAAVQVDPSGLALPYRPPVPLDHLVLHLPTASRTPVLPIGIPPQLSPAQRATYELLVKQALG